MPKKMNKTYRRYVPQVNHQKVKYQEKTIPQWKCSVCGQMRQPSEEYCLTCAQSLYYYCYINNQMFVAKDDSYLDIYYQTHSSETDCSDEQMDEPQTQLQINLGWVQDLLG